jgi:diadenosine tetraphosphate (Ap4A) HIT family hydrolase
MECQTCAIAEAEAHTPRGSIVTTSHWRAAHAFNTSLPGWLILVTREHVTALDSLDAEGHAELGTLLGQLSQALRTLTGCEKTYVMQFSETPGYQHLHIHLVPRMPDQPEDRQGPQVFGYLDVPEDEEVPADERDRIGLALRATLATQLSDELG